MLKLDDTFYYNSETNKPDNASPALPQAEFSIGDRCLLNAVRVDNKNDKCWIFRFLINNAGRIYGTWQLIDHKNKKTCMRIDNSYIMLLCLINLAMDGEGHVDEYGHPLPVYLYGELLGDDKIYNTHEFTNDYLYSKLKEYPDYDYRMSLRLTKEQYTDFVDGVASKKRAAVISPDWYFSPGEMPNLIVNGKEVEEIEK